MNISKIFNILFGVAVLGIAFVLAFFCYDMLYNPTKFFPEKGSLIEVVLLLGITSILCVLCIAGGLSLIIKEEKDVK